MNPIAKRVIPKVAGMLLRGPFKRLMDRRAAKGGKLVLWWRRNFGEIDGDKAADSMEDMARKYVEELEGKRRK
jgi:hypothetical protein